MTDTAAPLLTTTRLQQKIQAAIKEFGPKAEVFAYAICLAQRNEDHEWYTAHKREGTLTTPIAPVIVPERDGHLLITNEATQKAGTSTKPSSLETLPAAPPKTTTTKTVTASRVMKKPLRTSKPKPKKAQSFTGKPSASRFK